MNITTINQERPFFQSVDSACVLGLSCYVLNAFLSATSMGSESLLSKSLIALGSLGAVSLFQHLKQPEKEDSYCSSLEPIKASRAESPAIQSVRSAFQAKGLAFERIANSDEFICPDSCFSQVKEIMKMLSSETYQTIDEISYSSKEGAILFKFGERGYKSSGRNIDLDYSKISYPSSDQWRNLLKENPERRIRNSGSLLLTNGNKYSEQLFIENPVFKNTLEKHSVFRRLCALQKTESFMRRYEEFCEKIEGKDLKWADLYKDKPIDLAYISLFAYLNNKIDQEELFITQMLASAFFESVGTAQYTVLTQENVKEHLQVNNYLEKDQQIESLSCLENLEKKSLLKRTTISYQTDRGVEFLVCQIFEEPKRPTLGFKSINDPERVFVTLLPPWLSKQLYSETLSLDGTFLKSSPPTEHVEYFGYRRNLEDLKKGRPISYASCLFHLPQVHGENSKQLGITVHDAIGHASYDWTNPYTRHLISLGEKMSNKGYTLLASIILDRPVLPNTSDSDENLCDFMESSVFPFLKEPSAKRDDFFSFCKEIFSETVFKKIKDKFFQVNTQSS